MESMNPREDHLSECRSLGSNYQRRSQPRKISIGVLVDSVANSQNKKINKAVVQNAEDGTPNGNCIKDLEGRHTSLPQKEAAGPTKVASPWVSTRPFDSKVSPLVSVHEAEHTPGFTNKAHPRAKPPKKASAAQAVKYFAGKTLDLESDESGQKKFGKATHGKESQNLNGKKGVESVAFSTDHDVLPGKEPVEDKHKRTQTGGKETLRMKIWEIFENVSSPEKHCPGSEPAELQPEEEQEGKHSHSEKKNPNSDTIESDSEKPDHTSKRPLTRSATRTKASTKVKYHKVEAVKSTGHKKECNRKSVFSYKEDWPGRSYNAVTEGTSTYNRNKTERESSGAKNCQDDKYEDSEEKLQPESNHTSAEGSSQSNRNKIGRKSSEAATCQADKSDTAEKQQGESKIKPSAVGKSKFKNTKVNIAKLGNINRSEVSTEPDSGSKKNYSFEFQPAHMDEQLSDAEEPRGVFGNSKLKDQQEDRDNSFLKKKRDSIHETVGPTFQSKSYRENSSRGSLLKSDAGKLKKQSTHENIIGTRGIKSFKNMMSSKAEKCESNARAKSSDSGRDLKDCPATRSGSFVAERKENRWPISPDSTSSEDGSLMKDERDAGGEQTDSLPMKSRFDMEENNRDRLPKLPADVTDSESSEDDSHIKDVKDGGEEIKDNPYKRRSVLMEENRKNVLSKSPMNTTDSESSENGLPIKGCNALKLLSPEICDTEKFLRGRKKRPRKEKSVELTGCSPIPETGIEENLQQSHNDGLASAIALVTVALGRIKAKLKSVTTKKAAEILRTAGEEIFSQLQTAESQIKTDVGKLTSHCKSKRKRWEAKVQEQQEELVGIYAKFKEDVGKHIEDYGSVIQELEEQDIQLKGTAERQRAMHEELLLKAEQAIKAQLDDAENRVIDVQERAKKKMLQLKLVVAELQKSDLLS